MKTNTRMGTVPRWNNWTSLCCMCMGVAFILYFLSDRVSSRNGNIRFDNSSQAKVISVPLKTIMKGLPIALPQDDPRILEFIREGGFVKEPSEEPYNLKSPDRNPSMGQGQYIQKLFTKMKDGFFVECGGLDGETRSNSLTLEKDLGWKGLLVEADPKNFDMLIKKNRKAWAAKACLATRPFPHEVSFLQNFNVGKIVGAPRKDWKNARNFINVQCFPLYTLLSYLNVTTVDYFSLDVEGNELDVLKTIPFDSVFIKTLSVEFLHTSQGSSQLEEFMKSKGYLNVKKITNPQNLANDFIFVHGSQMDLLRNS